MKISTLIVNDEEGTGRSLKEALLKEGTYEVQLAPDPEEAFKIFSKSPSDIVVSDLGMPGMEGLSLLKTISRMRPSTVRIIVTSFETIEYVIEAMDEVIDGFVVKPLDINIFRKKIKCLFVKKQLINLLSPNFYRDITENVLNIFPKKSKVVVAFIDIKGFTGTCFRLGPERVVDLLCRNFYNPTTEIILSKGGLVDKYMGDGIMAVFGVVQKNENPLLSAVEASTEMIKIMKDENKRLIETFGIEFPISIGISQGEAVSGILGSDYKKDFTVLGDPVNRASKLSKLACPWEILLDSRVNVEEINLPVTLIPVKDKLFRKVYILE